MAVPHRRSDLPDAEMKLLYARSRNRCAFPGCGTILVRPGPNGTAENLGEAAHIIGSARQGPRGAEPVDQADRDRRASNRVLLCPTHHKVVDTQLTVYSVEVMRQMKADHETSDGAAPPDDHPPSVRELLHLSALPLVGIPSGVFSASLVRKDVKEGDIARSLPIPAAGSKVVFPFIARENRLWTFADLAGPAHPFGQWIDTDVETLSTASILADQEGHRRYVTLLNRALGRHLASVGVRFDPQHQRYWFLPAGRDGERRVTYTTKRGRTSHKPVVHHARRKSGEAKDEWYHEAGRLHFEQRAESWVLTVRPEFHITTDGRTPMPAHRIGRRVTRKKSHLYNDGYLDRLFFWRYFLTDGGPRLVIKTGEQSLVVDGKFATIDVRWPGVPGDSFDITAERAEETLFSLAELDDEGEVAEAWWDEDDDEDTL